MRSAAEATHMHSGSAPRLSRLRGAGGRAIGVALFLAALAGCAAAPAAASDDVIVEAGKRRTASGDEVAYALYRPCAATAAARPFPAVVLLHGFGRSHDVHRDNARDLAARGFVVLVPDMTSLLGGRAAQERNIQAAGGHLDWLVSRSEDPADPLAGWVDPHRLGLAGHSAGGAVALEAAVAAASGAHFVAALCLLDAVPWEPTIAAAGRLPATRVCSLRSEPGSWNAEGAVTRLLDALPRRVEDVLIVGASHVDVERPTTRAAALFAGPVHPACQAAYGKLFSLFFEEALAGRAGYKAAVEELRLAGRIALRERGGGPPVLR